MARVISAVEARRNLGKLLNIVSLTGEDVVIPGVEVVIVADLVA